MHNCGQILYRAVFGLWQNYVKISFIIKDFSYGQFEILQKNLVKLKRYFSNTKLQYKCQTKLCKYFCPIVLKTMHLNINRNNFSKRIHCLVHGLRTPGEKIAFTARPKIKSQSQIFRYGLSIFCLPHRPKFSDFFDLCLHWVSVVRGLVYWPPVYCMNLKYWIFFAYAK